VRILKELRRFGFIRVENREVRAFGE